MKKAIFNRRGYALLLVMMFVVLFSAVLGVAWRRVGAALRIEHVSDIRKECDRGSVQALAQAIKVLEMRLHNSSGTIAEKLDVPDQGTPKLSFKWEWQPPSDELAYSDPPDSPWYVITYTYNNDEWTIDVTSQKDEPANLDLLPVNPP